MASAWCPSTPSRRRRMPGRGTAAGTRPPPCTRPSLSARRPSTARVGGTACGRCSAWHSPQRQHTCSGCVGRAPLGGHAPLRLVWDGNLFEQSDRPWCMIIVTPCVRAEQARSSARPAEVVHVQRSNRVVASSRAGREPSAVVSDTPPAPPRRSSSSADDAHYNLFPTLPPPDINSGRG